MKAQPIALVLSLAAALGWVIWTLEQAERDAFTDGICPKEREAKRERVKANMRSPWEKAEQKMFGVQDWVEKKLQRSE